jgi:hypothetical protein
MSGGDDGHVLAAQQREQPGVFQLEQPETRASAGTARQILRWLIWIDPSRSPKSETFTFLRASESHYD